MATRGTPINAKYVAVNVVTSKPVSGDAANHAMQWVKDGVVTTPTNPPNEPGSIGVYQVPLTTAEATCNDGQIIGTSTTPNVVLIGQVYTFDPGPSGSGAFPMNIKITSDGTTPIPGAIVRITVNQPCGPLITNSSGIVTFSLNSGSVQVASTANGYNGMVMTSIIDGGGNWPNATSTLILTLTPIAVLATPPAGQVYATSTSFDLGIGAIPGQTIYYRLVEAPTGIVGVFLGDTKSAMSDSSGVFLVELWANSQYEFFFGRGEKQTLITTDVSPVAIPTLISAESANP